LLACLRDHLLLSGFGAVVHLGFYLSVRRTKKNSYTFRKNHLPIR
jgi:hypothetical protein